MVQGSFVFAFEGIDQVREVVILGSGKLSEMVLVDVGLAGCACDSCAVLVLAGRFLVRKRAAVWLVFTLFADDVSEGVESLFSLVYLLLQIAEGRLEIGELLLLSLTLLELDSPQQSFSHFDVEAVAAAIGGTD